MNELLQYSSIHKAISSATSKKLSSYLWYLLQELVGLALFDDRVFPATKRLMLQHCRKKKPVDHPMARNSTELFPFMHTG